mmetsp:Transcript_33259/g.93907  ORF Transcript_33259/g.93907 Transcript_33259/m.93907 type:complete len:405 (+) Transcript_33259:1-1215(+)
MLRAYAPDPLFSVVVPCVQFDSSIQEMLQSVFAQKISNWEIIVVDDHSSDHCGAAAHDWAAQHLDRQQVLRLRVLVSDRRSGTAESRNLGLRTARGVWTCALDLDTRLGEDYFLAAAVAMSRHPDVQAWYSDEAGAPSSSQFRAFSLIDDLSAADGLAPVAPLILRRVWAETDGYSAALPFGGEDQDFWLKLLAAGVRQERLPGAHIKRRAARPKTGGASGATQEVKRRVEEIAMLRTRHPLLYHPTQMLRAHQELANMSDSTYERLQTWHSDGSAEERAFGTLWLALASLGRDSVEDAERLIGDLEHALGTASGSASGRASAVAATVAAEMRWQPKLLSARCLCRRQQFDVASKVFSELSKGFPELAKTQAFHDLEMGCRAGAQWMPSVPAKDGSSQASQSAI